MPGSAREVGNAIEEGVEFVWLTSPKKFIGSDKVVGVEVNKIHRQRQIVKRIHVRVEHVRPSRSQLGHLERIKKNEALKAEAKKSGKPCPAEALRRQPKSARPGFTLDMNAVCGKKVHLLKPEPYVFRPLEKAYLK